MSVELAIPLFCLAALVITVAGVRMTHLADMLADRTGLGEAVIGGVLLGMSTSLSGTVTSVSSALDGLASLAVSNAVGGIAIQTVFLVLADMAYRRVNLEHAAADEKNMLQATVLILLLGLALGSYMLPPVTFWAVHPASILLLAVYGFGVRAAVALQKQPMWHPHQTKETRQDEPDEDSARPRFGWLVLEFCFLALILGAAGYVVARTGAAISSELGVSQTLVGALLTATATSLPELVTTLAAVRRGALQLAVGGIVGGNTFDVLFLSLSDVAYRQGSIYHAMAERDALLLVSAIILTAVLLMGLIMRDRRGIGFEGLSIIVVYAAVVAAQIALG